MAEQPPDAGSKPAGRISRDIWPRVLTAIPLAAAALGLCWWGVLPLSVIILVCAMAMSWEWSRLVRSTTPDVALGVHIVAVVAATLLAASGQAALAVTALAIGALILGALCFGESGMMSTLGVFYVGLPCVALIWLRSDGEWGFWAVIFVLVAVWATDTGGYFSGRLIGGPRLWPAISPNKTWAGLVGAVGASAAVGAVFASQLGAPVLRLALVGLLLGIVAQAGDLAESAMKRHYGVKDASSLLPGHGGFLDRLDGLVTAATAAGLMSLVGQIDAPGRALVFGW